MRIAYFWLTMGHYHFARMNAVADALEGELHVIEATNLDDHYWKREQESFRFTHHLMHSGVILNHALTGEAWKKIGTVLDDIKPDILVNGAGYFHPRSYIALSRWKKKSDGKLVLWTESTERDQKRKFIKELLKSKSLKLYDAALAAGKPHKQYLEKLGFPHSAVKIAGNVVDNQFFEHNTDITQKSGFLYVGRLLDIKNVDGLIRAYQHYRNISTEPEPLYIVGDGPELPKLKNMVATDRIDGVLFRGNLQVPEVKKMYEQSRYFILPSKSEPWGLVVNEALASGLPVMVSDKCGCANELVNDGKNGYIIDAESIESMSEKMLMLEKLTDSEYQTMVENALAHIAQFTPQTYARNCRELFQTL